MTARHLLPLALLLGTAVFLRAQEGKSAAVAWWEGKEVTGDWFGARTALADRGLEFEGRWRGIYFGVLASENGSGSAFSEEIDFAAKIDLERALRAEPLRGATLFGEVRWRDPGPDANPNNFVDADGLFKPSRYVGGVGLRLMSFGAGYVTPELFGVEHLLNLRAGWLQPQREFVEQPLARLFANNAMASAEGLGGNIPFTSSFSSWGGTLEIKPADWHYTKLGLFMSFPDPTNPDNHGLMFRGYESRPDQNGLFFMGETGCTPEIGPRKLPGHYAFGGYYYGESNAKYGGSKYGFYGQADQMVWRESSGGGALSKEGLRVFSLFVFAPAEDNAFSFYTHAGLVYEGLVPGRSQDEALIGVAVGQYGAAAASGAHDPAPSQSVLIEAGYRIKLNGWSFVQPFVQYIAQPDGTTAVANASILGVFLGVDF